MSHISQEDFLIKHAGERIRNNPTQKIARLDDKSVQLCIDYAMKKWKQGNTGFEMLMRDMEEYAKTLCVKKTP